MRRTGIVVALLSVLIAAAEWSYGQYLCDWEFCYPLDDTYIHLALARQLAETGTWGFDPGVPTFSSSSPLWTLLLAVATKLFGVHVHIPLVLSYLFSFASILIAFRFWRVTFVPMWFAAVSGIVLVLVIPFITLANLGMEHGLHFCLVEALLFSSWLCLAKEQLSGVDVAGLAIYSALATAARYETLFIVAPLAVILIMRRRPLAGASVFAAAFVPVVVFGLYSISCGRPFFPISLLLKANVGDGAIIRGICGLYGKVSPYSIHVYVAVALLLIAAIRRKTDCIVAALSFVFAVAIVGHVVFASIGWLYRYEAYLIGGAFTLLPAAIASSVPARMSEFLSSPQCDAKSFGGAVRKVASLGLCIGVGFPFVARGFKANFDTVAAMNEIHGQQMQMARIFALLTEEKRGAVAINDIGCMELYSGVHILDFWGLGSPDIADAIMQQRLFSIDMLADLFAKHGVRYFALYEAPFSTARNLPNVRLVAKLVRNGPYVVCAGDVFLGVTNESDVESFTRHLREFEKKLPGNVSLMFVR